jgi:hypothetical protein
VRTTGEEAADDASSWDVVLHGAHEDRQRVADTGIARSSFLWRRWSVRSPFSTCMNPQGSYGTASGSYHELPGRREPQSVAQTSQDVTCRFKVGARAP